MRKPIHKPLLLILLNICPLLCSNLFSPNWTHLEFKKFSRESNVLVHFYMDQYKLIWSQQLKCSSYDETDQCSDLRGRDSFFELKKFLPDKMFRMQSTLKFSKLTECPCVKPKK